MGGSQQSKPEELRVVLTGKTGAGKTSTLNTFLGEPAVESKRLASDNRPCATARVELGDQTLFLADTFSLCHTSKSKEEVLSHIIQSSFQGGRGPHVFLYVHKWEDGFTKQDRERVEVLRSMLGEKSMRHFLLLITHVDAGLSKSDDHRIRMFIQEVGFKTQQYCVINNRGAERQKCREKQNLVTQINQVAGSRQSYTTEMFREAQEALRRNIAASPRPPPADQHVTSVVKAMLSPVLPPDVVTIVILANTWLARRFDKCLRQ